MKNKNGERGTHRNLAGGNGAAASSTMVLDAGRRRRRRAGGNGGGFPLLFLGPAVKRKGHRNKEEGTVGVKRASYPHPRIYTEEVWVMGIVGSTPLPRPFLRKVATWRHGVGRRPL
jgi:hypothetical protein